MIYQEVPQNFNPAFEIAICFCEYQGEILLLFRQDYDTEGNKWCLPGGSVHADETPPQAMQRELREETGIDIATRQLNFFRKFYISLPERDYISHVFYVNLKEKPDVVANVEEHKDFKWVRPAEALSMNLLTDGGETIKLFLKR